MKGVVSRSTLMQERSVPIKLHKEMQLRLSAGFKAGVHATSGFKMQSSEAGEMVQPLTTCSTLAEDQRTVPSTHFKRISTGCNSGLGKPLHVHKYTYIETHLEIMKINL